MSIACSNTPKVAYGLDFFGDGVCIVKAARKRGLHWEQIDFGGDSADWTAVLENSRGKKRSNVVVGMPVNASFAQWIEAPFPSESKARRVFDSLLDARLPFPVDDCIRSYAGVQRTPDRKVSALAVGARKVSIADFIEEMHAQGLNPEVIDNEGVALWHLARAEFPDETESASVIAYLSSDRLLLAVGNSGQFTYSRSTELEYEGDALSASCKNRLKRRMATLLSSEESAVNLHWIWVGPSAGQQHLRKAVESTLGTDIQADSNIAEEPKTFLARALALRGVGKLEGALNLRSSEFTHPALLKAEKRKSFHLAASLLIGGVLLCGGNIAWDRILGNAVDRYQSNLQEQAKAVTGMERMPRGQEVEIVRRHIEKLKSDAEPFVDCFKSSSGFEVLRIMGWASEKNMQIHNLSIRSGRLNLAASAVDWDDPRWLADQCRKWGYVIDLQRENAGESERVEFELEGRRSEG